MIQPLISIITITYQAESVLASTLESVLRLNYSAIEYILVDGDSKDKTIQIAKSFINKFHSKNISFRWISEPDNGLYDAMNKGLKMATGEYIWFMNAGDRIASSNCLEKIFNDLEIHYASSYIEHETINSSSLLPDFIYGETAIIDKQGHILGARRLKVPENLNWKSFRMGMLVCHQSMLVKKEISPEFNINYRYSADFDWAIHCMRNAKSLYNSHLVLSHFLEGGVSKKKMRASLKERFRIMALNYGWFSTVIRHLWFMVRALWFKLIHGWI